ncbi:hypothetical protein H5T51_04115 [Candidatus Bathyarchaeota archaeon]|nr:hypothetical protein [Candidatus Bathyarchaeota archaeon]
MSRLVLSSILAELGLKLEPAELQCLYNELLVFFGLVGALNECEALENAWRDPYNRRQIMGFIKAWFKTRRKPRKEIMAWVV